MSKMVPTVAGSQVPLTYMAMIENLSLFRGTPRANLCHTLGKIASNPANFRALTDAGAISALSHVLSSEEVGSLSRSAACECLNVFARVRPTGCTVAVSYPPTHPHTPPLPPPPPPSVEHALREVGCHEGFLTPPTRLALAASIRTPPTRMAAV